MTMLAGGFTDDDVSLVNTMQCFCYYTRDSSEPSLLTYGMKNVAAYFLAMTEIFRDNGFNVCRVLFKD